MTDDAPAKSISERMWERVDASENSSSSRNRIEFLRAKDDIQAALDEGWSGRMIWEQLRDDGRIRFGHSAFAKYVRTLIQGKPALGTPRSATKRPTPARQRAEAQNVASTPKPKPAGFFHNPSPRKEDLI